MISSKGSLKNRVIKNIFLNVDEDKFNEYEIDEIHSALIEDGLYYFRMRLPISKITQEYIDTINNHIGFFDLKIEIYEATKEDLTSILYIHKRAWKNSHILFVPTSKETFEILFDYLETKILIARLNGENIGYIILDCEGKNREFGVIDGMGILPEFQGRKIGLIMCLEAWDYLKKMNFEELRFEIYIENKKCIQLAKLLNFELYKIKRYPYNQIEI